MTTPDEWLITDMNQRQEELMATSVIHKTPMAISVKMTTMFGATDENYTATINLLEQIKIGGMRIGADTRSIATSHDMFLAAVLLEVIARLNEDPAE